MAPSSNETTGRVSIAESVRSNVISARLITLEINVPDAYENERIAYLSNRNEEDRPMW